MGGFRVTRSVNGEWLVVNAVGEALRSFATQREAWREADKMSGDAISVGEDWSHYVAKAR